MTGPSPTSAPDVQGLRPHGRPAPALRLSRKVLIGGSCIAGIVLGGCVMLALQPPSAKPAKAPEPVADTQTKPVADQFNALPKDYSQVPVLGPPLNGDLGKPILAAETRGQLQASQASFPPANGLASASAPMPSVEARSTTLARQAVPDDHGAAAITSQLFTLKTPAETTPSAIPTTTTAPPLALAGLSTAQPQDSKSTADRQNAFLSQPADRVVVSPDRLQSPASATLIQAGSIIPAALVTGIRSDLPGQVIAQVTQNIYDSLTGRILLIPQGARLIGQYDNAIAFGQNRVLLAWNRLILPDGRSIVLEKLSAADTQGLAGLSDQTDYHWTGMLQAAALSTLLSVGTQAGASDQDSDIIHALRDGAADSISRTGQQIVERQLNIQPTLTIRPGFPLRVILTRDLVLEPLGQ